MINLKLKTFLLTGIVLIGLALASCETDNNHAFVPESPEGPSVMQLVVNGERYDVSLPASQPVDLRTLCTEFPADIQVLNASAFRQISINGQSLTDGRLTLPVDEISYLNHLEVLYEAGRGLGSVRLRTLHNGIPPIWAEGQAEAPGHFYLSFIWRPLIMKYDHEGRLVYFRYEPTANAGTPQELGFWDFKKHVFDGKVYYSYHAPDPNFADRAVTGYCPGMRILMDDHYQPVDTIHALRSRDGYLNDGDPLDGHDFLFFSPTHWISSASYVEREVNGRRLAVAYLQEVDNGKVVADWWSTDYPAMAEWGSTVFDTSYDYVHFNAIDILPNGYWLCSFRTVSSLLAIEPQTNGPGIVHWRINGETLPEAYRFYGQHYARYHKDYGAYNLTLFDNGNGHRPQHTRLLQLHINPDTGEFLSSPGGDRLHDASGYFTLACGAYQDFGPGKGFVAGWGWSMTEGDNARLVTEFDAQGNEIFSLRHMSPNLLLNELNSSYRCVKCE